ncbi:ABC transporter substrate-binding protein [Agrococcus pavilionensis]|uniref:ABC transporter substrate-binding protein n=1 Tax=Agrococcus pavilionensis TaxID=1346502 RepID=UPI00118195C3|nr:peptide ABC transporter substrate-binding protein [Agrococcus pavilionensis]
MHRINRRRRWALIAPVAATATLLAGCSAGGGATPTDDPAAEGPSGAEIVRMANFGQEGNITPHTYETATGYNLLGLVYDSLLQIDEDGVPQPWLAEELTISDDGLTYTMPIRDDAVWHDGEPLTAEDVAFSFDYYQNGPPGRFRTAVSAVESATADSDTVTVQLTQPAASFELRTLAEVPILPEHIWSSIPAPDEAPFDDSTNVGSGPYRLVESDPGTSYMFEMNPDYFAGTPTVEEIRVIQFANDAGAVAALRSGEVDMITRSVTPEQIPVLNSQEGLSVLEGPEYVTTLLVFDTQKEPFSNVAVRQAMDLATDRELLVSDVYLGAAIPGNAGWVHPESPFFDESVETTFDVDAANALLDDAGITDSDGDGVRELDGEPLEVELLAVSSNALRMRIAELLASQYAEIGMNIEVASLDQEAFDQLTWPEYDVALGRNYDMAVFGWSAPTQADIGQMGALVDSDPTLGNLNIMGYVSDEADALAAELRTESDPDARAAVADELQALIAEELPLITLLYPNGLYGHSPAAFDGWTSITGQGPINKLSFIPADARP